MRIYENKKAELATYENNISFLTSKSKKGSVLIDTMLKKIENLKADLADIAERINRQQNEQSAPETPAETTDTPAKTETPAETTETPAEPTETPVETAEVPAETTEATETTAEPSETEEK